MAETFRKSKIEKVVERLEIKKQVYNNELSFWENSPITLDKCHIDKYINKIELINEILTEINNDFNLS